MINFPIQAPKSDNCAVCGEVTNMICSEKLETSKPEDSIGKARQRIRSARAKHAAWVRNTIKQIRENEEKWKAWTKTL